MLAGTKSKCGNKYVEVFVAKFGLSRAFPMEKKGIPYKDISLLFQRDGVPPKMIVGGLKEKTLGLLKRKVAEAGCHLRQTELEYLWQIAA